MRKIIVTVLIVWSCTVFAQVTNVGIPTSWAQQLSKKSITPVIMPSFELQKLKEEDAINDKVYGKLYRFGHEFKVDFGMQDSGSWDILPDGSRVWRIHIISKGAKTLNFVFDTYRVPTGASVYLYNDDRTDLIGAYTNVFNREDEMLGTWLVKGESVWVEYHEPKKVLGKGALHFSRVVHGYRSIDEESGIQKNLNDSGSCNLDVDCSIGDDFDPIKDKLKKSVGFIVLNGFICTGTLINNTNNDKAPYFLTANHCNEGPLSTWAFRFNWISPNPSCATTTPSTDTTIEQTTSGATNLMNDSISDVRLIQLDGGLDPSWDLEWAGWDWSGEIPDYVVGLHHPIGDIMKICRDDDPVERTPFNFGGNPETQMWIIEDWDFGVTEGGSSGSALFNSEGRIIGQLAGGRAACQGTTDNNDFDLYGRLEVSWNARGSGNKSLANFLDPNNTGRKTHNMLSESNDTPSEPDDVNSNIIMYRNPSNDYVAFSGLNNEILRVQLFDLYGSLIYNSQISEAENRLDISTLASGMYFGYFENITSGGAFVKRIIRK